MKHLLNTFAVVMVLVHSTSFAGADCGQTTESVTQDFVDTAVAAGQFKTLAAALGAAGLADTLKGAGPLTLFAPTDAALKNILLYQLPAGELSVNNLVDQKMILTVQGKVLEIRLTERRLFINGSQVIAKPVKASNGVIYVIDTVLLP